MTESTCRNCGYPIAYGPYWGDGRLLDPPIWFHADDARSIKCRRGLTETHAEPTQVMFADVARPRDVFRALDEIHDQVMKMRRVLLCAPEDEERIRGALDTLPWNSGAGLLDVRPSPHVPRDRIYVFDPTMPAIDPKGFSLMGYPHFKTECAEHHDIVRDFGGPKPPIVVLCGSTRFTDEFNHYRKVLTEAGEIVLSIEVVTTQSREEDPQHADPDLKARLDELHKRKIDLADYVLVLDVGGYIGESTRSEIEYAERLGRPVHYLSQADPSKSREGFLRQAMDKVHADYGDAIQELGNR